MERIEFPTCLGPPVMETHCTKPARSPLKEKSCDLQPVGKEKHDPNAVTTKAVVASVGTGCGGFLG